MPYMQVFTVKYCFVYVGFSLADSFFESVVAGGKGSYGGRKRAARTMKIATLYFCCSNRLKPPLLYNTSHISLPDKCPPFTNTAQ